MASLTNLRKSFEGSELFAILTQLDDTTRPFTVYLNSLAMTVDLDNYSFKGTLANAEKEFGDFEEKMDKVMKEVKDWKGKLVEYSKLY